MKQWKNKADRGGSLISTSLPIVIFIFLKSCNLAGKNPILYFLEHTLLFASANKNPPTDGLELADIGTLPTPGAWLA